MALQGNPWTCSCDNVWLGKWLRRWMRETLQLHTSVVERGQAIQSVVRRITCRDGGDGDDARKIPLVDLDEDRCRSEDEVSAAARISPATAWLASASAALLLMASSSFSLLAK